MTDASAAAAVVVIVAMEEEAAPFLERAESVTEVATGAHAVRRDLGFGGDDVVLLRSGIGFANAVAAAAYARYTLGSGIRVISAGTAGGLAAGVQVGEVVVGSRYLNLNADATAFGYALGQVPGMPAAYAPDAGLAAAALAADSREQAVRPGTIGSSEAFVVSDRALRFRADFPDVLAVDMETAALAQFAHTHGLPFVSIRAISDLCAPDGTEFLTHVDDAAARSADVVAATIMAL
ncbi:5'-methylthioadenosine/S-adenosylhomocysteine nucleosidase [Gryllotalpicola protaetiae]|uniref:adenosylhomocysteine nucleosidase n=2 Tax=Gryllotalpicola protaetiae TaxID=2419771 RepID=A0A387BNT2_9MICO|nr:5'-methylthioadenosine/S-adenosylhomocysteine nucleosidase [Gryllotalpicola protaetiae]